MAGPRKLVLIGIGAGNPEWITLKAIAPELSVDDIRSNTAFEFTVSDELKTMLS